MTAIRPRPEFKWWDVILGLLAILFIVLAWFGGLAVNVVNVLLMGCIPVALGTRIRAGFKGKLETGFVRRPFASEHRWFLVQALVRWAFLGVWVLVLRASIVPAQLGDELESIRIVLALVLTAWGLFALFPKKRILASRLIVVIALTLFFAGQLVLAAVPVSASEAIAMDAPLRSEFVVFQGGNSPLLNHHFLHRSQRNALDLVVLKNGKLFDGNEAELASHGCFGQPVHAPLSGTVVKVVNDRPDMPYGKVDRQQIVGNNVVLKVGPERYVLFAHLKHGSVLVHEGERVDCGKVLAQCGNSGNTTMPHLHLQVQNRPELTVADVWTYPIVFRNAVIVRGAERRTDPTVLRRNDRVRAEGTMSP